VGCRFHDRGGRRIIPLDYCVSVLYISPMMNRKSSGPCKLSRHSEDGQAQGAPAPQPPCGRSAGFPGGRSFPARQSLSAGGSAARSAGGSRLTPPPEAQGVPASQVPFGPGGTGPGLTNPHRAAQALEAGPGTPRRPLSRAGPPADPKHSVKWTCERKTAEKYRVGRRREHV
jgi:hypothetical protein